MLAGHSKRFTCSSRAALDCDKGRIRCAVLAWPCSVRVRGSRAPPKRQWSFLFANDTGKLHKRSGAAHFSCCDRQYRARWELSLERVRDISWVHSPRQRWFTLKGSLKGSLLDCTRPFRGGRTRSRAPSPPVPPHPCCDTMRS